MQNEVRSVTSRLEKLEQSRATDTAEAERRHNLLIQRQSDLEKSQKEQAASANSQFAQLLAAIERRNSEESPKVNKNQPAQNNQTTESNRPDDAHMVAGPSHQDMPSMEEIFAIQGREEESRSPKQRTLALMAQKRSNEDSEDPNPAKKQRLIPSGIAKEVSSTSEIRFTIPKETSTAKSRSKQSSRSKSGRTKALNDAERQQLRNEYTEALISIPDWFQEEWSVPAYVTNRFYWTHEQTRVDLGQLRQHKGPTYPLFRNQWHIFGVQNIKKYDDDRRQTLEELKKKNEDIILPKIMPWYRVHQKSWDRAHIHPQTNRCSIPIGKFKFLTNFKFLDTFLEQIGWYVFYLLCS